MKLVAKAILLTLIAGTQTGCDELTGLLSTDLKDVRIVKNYVYEAIDNTVSIGDMLDNRKICKEPQWTAMTDDNNRRYVYFKCKLVDYEQYGEKWTSDERAKNVYPMNGIAFLLTKKDEPIVAGCGALLWGYDNPDKAIDREFSYNISQCVGEIYETGYSSFMKGAVEKVHDRYFNSK